MPFSPLMLLLFLLLLGWMIAFVQLGLVSLMFHKLGLSPQAGFTLLFGSLIGSAINLPLCRVTAERGAAQAPERSPGLLRPSVHQFTGTTIVAVNLGGCIIPVLFSIYLLQRDVSLLFPALLGTAVVALLSYHVSRPLPGLGIGMPILIAPATAAFVALLLAPGHGPAIAYVSGTLGVLIGADLLHLNVIPKLGTPLASIGGAGTFDGIFLTGIVAVLLA